MLDSLDLIEDDVEVVPVPATEMALSELKVKKANVRLHFANMKIMVTMQVDGKTTKAICRWPGFN